MARKNRPLERAIKDRAQHSFDNHAVEEKLEAIAKAVQPTAATVRRVNYFGPVRKSDVEEVRSIRMSQCCTPFPYAVFRRESLQSISYMHRGIRCIGTVSSVSVGAWRAA